MTTIMSRRSLLGVFAATAVTAAPRFVGAAAFLRDAGDIRRLKMYNGRTGESLDTIYWIEGYYIADALAEVNNFFRDWRRNETKEIDTRTIDILAASHKLMDTSEPYLLLSGYRSRATNNLLRSRSKGVARNSLHIVGQAADVRLGSRSIYEVTRAATSCQAGGVGTYRGSNFVHMDCGRVRSWNG